MRCLIMEDQYVKDKTFRNTASDYFSMAIIIAAS